MEVFTYIAPDCGLKIQFISAKDADNTHKVIRRDTGTRARKFVVSNPEDFPLRDGEELTEGDCQGWMSPTHNVTLPEGEKVNVGIPRDGTKFSYIYPLPNVADKMDWKKLDLNSFAPIQSRSFRDDTDDSAIEIKTNKAAMFYIALLGGYAYFDEEDELICINAISFSKTNYDLNMSGPFEASQFACEDLRHQDRVHLHPIGIYHEAGVVSIAWVHPYEKFQSKGVTESDEIVNDNGALVFYRSNGSAMVYIVDPLYVHATTNRKITLLDEAFVTARAFFNRTFSDVHNGDFNIVTKSNKARNGNYISEMLTSFRGFDKSQKIKVMDKIKHHKMLVHDAILLSFSCDVIKALVDQNDIENLGHEDDTGWLPLHYACCMNASLELISFLIKKNPKAVLHRDKFNRTPLHIACFANAPYEVISSLLSADTLGETLAVKTKFNGWLPIHFACMSGMSDQTIYLLIERNNSDRNIKQTSWTAKALPLHFALQNKMSARVIKLLVEQSSNNFSFDSKSDKDKSSVIKGFLRLPSIGNETDGPLITMKMNGMLPLHIACSNQASTEIVQILLNEDITHKTLFEEVGNSEFSFEESHDIAVASHSVRANQNITHMLPLHLAIIHKSSVDVIRILLQREIQAKGNFDSSIYAKDCYGRCALHLACIYDCHIEIIQLLLDFDYTNETTQYADNQNSLPIHYACQNKEVHPSVLRYLMENEAAFCKSTPMKQSTHMLDAQGYTPLKYAIRENLISSECYEYLLAQDNFYIGGLKNDNLSKLAKVVSQNQNLQAQITNKISERGYFGYLVFYLYLNIATFTTFLIATIKMRKDNIESTEPYILCFCISSFIAHELLQLQSQKGVYFYDKWNLIDISRIILLIFSVLKMFDFVNGKEMNIPNNLFIATFTFVVFGVVVMLKSIFLPFARFTGALIVIFKTLIPFFIVTGLILTIFSYSFTLKGNENCPLFEECYMWVLQGIFSGTDDTRDVLDVLFGIISIIILLNVLIAIVSEAWGASLSQVEKLFWFYRLSYLSETKAFSYFNLSDNRFFQFVDDFSFTPLTDTADWKDAPFNLVSNKKMYENPEMFFQPTIAQKIIMARSLKATLYWIKLDNLGKPFLAEIRIIAAVLKWMTVSALYIVFLIFGLVTFGWSWPKDARRALLSVR
mmetsp:Transcript_17604/g.24826  ORF Transcript_17604/g.24826 Transcript_17604/m.24826 type:complete len:1155 (-) Transcript_17604:261-3725(-)